MAQVYEGVDWQVVNVMYFLARILAYVNGDISRSAA